MTDRVVPRITRDALAAPRMERARIRLGSPGPRAAISERTTTSAGKDIQASTTRWITMSYAPPRYALETPTAVAISVARATVAKPTVTEIRAPYTTRLHTSRERLSVPIQNCALGGRLRAPRIDSSYRYGAIRSANTAMTSSARTITPPMAPRGLRRGDSDPRPPPPGGRAGPGA